MRSATVVAMRRDTKSRPTSGRSELPRGTQRSEIDRVRWQLIQPLCSFFVFTTMIQSVERSALRTRAWHYTSDPALVGFFFLNLSHCRTSRALRWVRSHFWKYPGGKRELKLWNGYPSIPLRFPRLPPLSPPTTRFCVNPLLATRTARWDAPAPALKRSGQGHRQACFVTAVGPPVRNVQDLRRLFVRRW